MVYTNTTTRLFMMHTFNVGTRLIPGELGNPLVLLPSVFCPCGYETVHSLQCKSHKLRVACLYGRGCKAWESYQPAFEDDVFPLVRLVS